MFNLTDLLDQLGAHFSLVVIACIELLAAALLVARAVRSEDNRPVGGRRSAVGKAGENGAELLRALNFRRFEANLLLRRADMMPLYAVGDLAELLGLPLESLQEDLAAVLPNMADGEATRSLWKTYQHWDGTAPLHRELQRTDGEWLTVDFRRLQDEDVDLITIYRSTDLHGRLEQYEHRLQDAEDASQSKTTFLSRMSHEIRTPMNGIIGMLTLAKSRLSADNPAMQYLHKADELSDHLLSLINDILDMSRIEAGKVELEHKPFSLRKLGTKLYDMFAKNLEARGIRYAVEYENVTVDYLIGDELRISQIIINFLSNAVKFTEKGEIVVTFRQMMLRNGVADLMIRVHDTGAGMEPEFINRIFRPFEQESIEIGHRYGGTGLGMAITDQLVRLMGGEIVVESQPGKGSDFSVFLHLPVTERPARPAVAEGRDEAASRDDSAFVGRRILMAEDNEINAEIAQEVLSGMGAKVDVVGDGQQAVDAFNGHGVGYYDFILLDVQMPVMDGRTAARTIRRLPRAAAAGIPIFALSADAFVEDERLSAEAGMNGHFAKPVDFTALQHSVGRFLAKKERKTL